MGVLCWLSHKAHTQKMGKASKCPVRKSPILLSSWRNKNSFKRHKMMRMSLKKLRKIGDPENLLHRAVLINNTLESVRNLESAESSEHSEKMDAFDHSNYSPEEEEILNSIKLPAPITPISDAQDNTEEAHDSRDNTNDSVVECLLRTLPNSITVKVFTKSDVISQSEKSSDQDQSFLSKQEMLSQTVLNISLLHNLTNSNSYLVAF